MKNRIVCLVSVTLIIMFSLFGCGGGGGQNSVSGETSGTTLPDTDTGSETTPPDVQRAELTSFWGTSVLFSGSAGNSWERGALTVSSDSFNYSGVTSQ